LSGPVARNTGSLPGTKKTYLLTVHQAFRLPPLTFIRPYWLDVNETHERVNTTAPCRALAEFNEL